MFNLNLNEFQSMMDMRDALTAEVADKHDIIVSLRRDIQQLEEQCRQIDKQALFKDDIIKELRKEIKQLKTQVGDISIPILTLPNLFPTLTIQKIKTTEILPMKEIFSRTDEYVIRRKSPVRVKHRAEKEEANNSSIIYIRESSMSPKTRKIKKNNLTISEKPLDNYANKSERNNNGKSSPRKLSVNSEALELKQYMIYVKDDGDNFGDKRPSLERRSKNKVKSKLTGALVSNCSYIPEVHSVYNQYHTEYVDDKKASDSNMSYNRQSGVWW